MRSDFYNESGVQKVTRRIKEEPLVPLGCLLTVAAFTNAYRAMRRGDHHQVQRMFRARVAAQAFTIVAMVAGGMYYSADRHKQKELRKLQQQQDAEEKRQKWIKELEARDEEDKAVKERLEKRRKRATERVGAGTGTESVAEQARSALRGAKEAKGMTAEETRTAAVPFQGLDKDEGAGSGIGSWFRRSKTTPGEPAQTSDPLKPISEDANK